MRNRLFWLSWAGAALVELALVGVLRDGRIFGWEQDLERIFQKGEAGELAFVLTSWLTNTLSLSFLLAWSLIVLVAFAARRWRIAFVLLTTFPLHFLAQFPKAIVDRPRPSDAFPGLEGVGGTQSFPSGHSEFVVSFYGLLTYFACRHLHGASRAALVAAWLLLVFLTGYGRLAEGRHWPMDVVTSYVIGAGLLSGLIWLDMTLRRTAEILAGAAPGRANISADHASVSR